MGKIIKAYTDGSCLCNPGIGGFATVIQMDGVQKICKGYSKNPRSTNNRMELMAIVYTLIWTAKNVGECHVQAYTDSMCTVQAYKHDKFSLISKERANNDLWSMVFKICEDHNITLEIIKLQGHSGIPQNELADKLAREQAVKARHIMFGGRK